MNDDLISRQAAIDAVKKLSLGETDATRLAMRIGDYLERLPPVQLSLEAIVHPQILDDAEKQYLSAVIRPFRNQIISIYKEQFGFNHESIIIEYYDFDSSHSTLCLPQFEKWSMYAGMKQGKHYPLEELGL